MNLSNIFGSYRVVGLAGDKSTGKTNNLMYLIKDFRKDNNQTHIYFYGFDDICIKWLKQFKNVYEISSLEQLTNKKDSLIIMDEFQKLKLNDRRYTDLLNSFIDFIYHNNNWVIFSTPNLREFNSNIGGKIERWAIKSLSESNLINGSQLKTIISSYAGRYKVINDIRINKDKILILNDEYEQVIECPYIPEIDRKKENVNIFNLSEKLSVKLSKINHDIKNH